MLVSPAHRGRPQNLAPELPGGFNRGALLPGRSYDSHTEVQTPENESQKPGSKQQVHGLK